MSFWYLSLRVLRFETLSNSGRSLAILYLVLTVHARDATSLKKSRRRCEVGTYVIITPPYAGGHKRHLSIPRGTLSHKNVVRWQRQKKFGPWVCAFPLKKPTWPERVRESSLRKGISHGKSRNMTAPLQPRRQSVKAQERSTDCDDCFMYIAIYD